MIVRSIIVSLILILAGCATIAKGTSQLVTINCNIDNALIYLDGKKIGETPFSGKMKKNGKMLTIRKDGYKEHQIALTKHLEGIFWGNIITGGTVGSITDFATGAAYTYSPSSFQVDLIKMGMPTAEFKKESELRKFAMINMSNIAIDLSNGSGDYLSTLLALSGKKVNSENKMNIANYLNTSNGDQVVFGRLVVKNI